MSEAGTLARVLGPVTGVSAEPLVTTTGYSGSRHTRLHLRLANGAARSLVLKRTQVAGDWLSARTDDRVGREGQLLGEPSLDDVWSAFACPYLAWAAADGEVALLMDDLSDFILPDVREPIAVEHEAGMLAAVAAQHARYWESPALDLPWLTRPAQLLGLLNATELARMAPAFPHPVVERAHAGWQVAFARLPTRAAALLRQSPDDLAARAAHLPRTLTHGDFKVANFALLPDGRVAAFDWAVVGATPVATELGWHLAVNATRLPGTKEESIVRYMSALESALGRALGERFWKDTVESAVLMGAAMLLWSKAMALASGLPRAEAEWDWWVERLEAL